VKVLADTTAMVAPHRGGPDLLALLDELDELWICEVVRLEFLRGALNPRHMTTLRADLDQLLIAPTDARAWQRAEEVYAGLARMRGGRHHGMPLAAVLVAATAEVHGLSVLHDDKHFDLIAQVTDQPMIRLS
jgi:predicted nucleic acid-binding protein